MKTHFLRFAALAVLCGPFLAAQPADDTQLKQMIVFGRHGVRTPVFPNTTLFTFSALPFPLFTVPGVAAGTVPPVAVLTTNGGANEAILGGYFRQWLIQEGLLTGNDSANAASVYFRANNTPLIVGTAQAFWTGMLPRGRAKH